MSDCAHVLLGRLNAIARLTDAGFQPVALAGRFDRPAATGGVEVSVIITDSAVVRDHVTVAHAGTAEGRATAYNATGVPQAQPYESHGRRVLDLARADPDVTELLDLLGTSELEWDDLYRAFEIVRDASKRAHTGTPRWSLEQLGYEKQAVSDFTCTVNLHRHARPSGQPKHELTLDQARQFVREMAARWFQQPR